MAELKPISDKRFLIEIVSKAIESTQSLMDAQEQVYLCDSAAKIAKMKMERLASMLALSRYRERLISELEPSELIPEEVPIVG